MDLAGADVQIAQNIERIKAESRIREREQRRYEIARDVMAAFAVGKRADINMSGYWPQEAVKAADALLAALEEER